MSGTVTGLTYERAQEILREFNGTKQDMAAALMAGWLLAGDGVKAVIAKAFIEGYETHQLEVKRSGGIG